MQHNNSMPNLRLLEPYEADRLVKRLYDHSVNDLGGNRSERCRSCSEGERRHVWKERGPGDYRRKIKCNFRINPDVIKSLYEGSKRPVKGKKIQKHKF